jgi:hypothetical protein
MMTSPGSMSSASRSAVGPAKAAGTMIHAARGLDSLLAKSSSDAVPMAPSPSS